MSYGCFNRPQMRDRHPALNGKTHLNDLGAKPTPAYMLPLCDCGDHGASCLGRKEGRACMAHDKWYVRPCDEGACPGPFHHHCCHKADPNELPDDDHGCYCY